MALSSYTQTGVHRLVKSNSNGRLIAAALEFISAHSEILVIAPTHSAGEELAYATPGRAGLHRMTLLQLAADLARPLMAEKGHLALTSLGLEALAARAVYMARREKDLSYFTPVSTLPGFARAVARTFRELRLAKINPDDLAASGAPGADLSALLRRYEAELEERSLADLARVLDLAAQAAAENHHRWMRLPLLWFDVPLDSPAHRALYASIAARAPAVFTAVSSDEDVFAEILGMSVEDLDTTGPLTSLEHLRRYLFSVAPPPAKAGYAGFELFSAPGEGLEAVEIARRILRLARDGKTFDRMAILLRAAERYQPILEDALGRARIPAYFSRGTVRPDPAGRAFLALLACAAEKCSASRFAEYLSLGQVPPFGFKPAQDWIAAQDEMLTSVTFGEADQESPAAEVDEKSVPRAPAAWERLLVDAAVIGGRDRWRRRLHGLERELELHLTSLERDDDPRRDRLSLQLDRLRQLQRFALPLIDELYALPSVAPWGEWLDHLTRLSKLALRRPEPVLAVLAEFVPMSEVGPVTLEEVAGVLSDRLRFLRSDPPHRRYGRVFIGSIEESRGREFDIVFLPGLAEGLFPQRALEDPLLLDDFRREIAKSLPLRDERATEERLRLRLAVAAARERLIASYPRMEVAEVRPRVPSFYALELPRAIEGRLPELKEFERRAREAAPARLNWPAPRDSVNAIDDFEYDLVSLDRALATGEGARYLMEANTHLARSLRARWRRWAHKWTEADGLITKDPDALAALGAHRLNARAWSPSALQQFAICPYKFALSGIYRLRPREQAVPIEQLDPLTRGALFHAVQFALLGELKSRALLPVSPERLTKVLELADRALDEIAAKYREDLVPAIPRVWDSEIEDLRTDLRGWLQHIAANDGEWEPIHFEFAFGLSTAEGRDSASTKEEADLMEGVRLRGSIDLVERHTAPPQVLRVTDHKTEKMPENIPAYVGGGRFLQPLLYSLAAEKLLGATVESGRLFYATQQGGYNSVEIRLIEKARQFLGKLLDNIDRSISTGFLPPAPQKDACETCDYRLVCGPYEELRLARHKDRGDERLESLTEIRGML